MEMEKIKNKKRRKKGIVVKTKEEKREIRREKEKERKRKKKGINKDVDGILVPGGFGIRGIEGMLVAVGYARVNLIPYLGLCLGMQCLVIEFARNVANLDGANSSEFNPDTKYPVIDLMEEQQGVDEKGGTMRLGHY